MHVVEAIRRVISATFQHAGRQDAPGHADHLPYIGDPRRMEDRKIRGFTDFAGKIEIIINVCEMGIGEDPATNDIEERCFTEIGRDLIPSSLSIPPSACSSAGRPIGPGSFGMVVFERAVVVAGYLVNERRSETVEEMAVALTRTHPGRPPASAASSGLHLLETLACRLAFQYAPDEIITALTASYHELCRR